ncbi:MAG: tRNA pseudouridine(55) synthase TruB [Patescibacteria group bacterium]
MLNGIFAVNKPKGPSSFAIIHQIRKLTGEKRIGHAGTLDPLASGVLVVAVGRENTKKINDFVKKEKEYLATVKFGFTSATDDEEGEKTEIKFSRNIPMLEEIESVCQKFIGNIQQIPPIFSAIKINGQKSYDLARKNKAVEMKPRDVFIKEIKIEKYSWPFLQIKVVCGPGVYIRSLSKDIGAELGVGGYMADLVRTRVGEFILENALNLDELVKND